MLVLSRKAQESIIVNGNIKITVVRIDRNQVRIGIDAPTDVPIQREELVRPGEPEPATASLSQY
jgi:carbon storage regulator